MTEHATEHIDNSNNNLFILRTLCIKRLTQRRQRQKWFDDYNKQFKYKGTVIRNHLKWSHDEFE